ncbi:MULTISPECIES: hypothetical protein [Paenibacillus]|jgi:hypothetical protein|uniref:hypothetical protein n=1 Tax=Paenibacillus TaxID=44249 RepID=UPI0004F7C3DE|nr:MULTISPECIES: hypothetical protein [unclassified Paenibacillus]AIQ28982.1 hypothetical protein P40081_12980 [Paenibacillus sp. FSL P4-0081]OMF27775.1 hypothetical protein BK132_16050 [Paenibacillus sp. FSL H8-0259]
MKVNKKIWLFSFLLLLGGILAAAGLLTMNESTERLAGLGLGIGSGLFSMSAAQLIIQCYYAKHPKLRKQAVIELRDERHTAIRMKAKAKAFDVMIVVMIALPFLFIFGGTALWVVLSTIGLYVFGCFLQLFYIRKYSKQM